MCLFRSVCITLVMCAVLLLQTLAPERASASDALTAPAVSALNGKFSIQGGLFSDEPTALGLGSLSIPLTHSFGIQLDGALGSLDGDTLRGAGVHLFHRDPAKFLLGAYGSYHSWRSVDIWRAALEAEAQKINAFQRTRFCDGGHAVSKLVADLNSGRLTIHY